MSDLKSKRFRTIYFSAIFLLLIAYLSFRYFRRKNLYENAKIVNGFVDQINHGGAKAGNIVIKYHFFLNNKRYDDGIDSGLEYSVRDSLLNRWFPVLIDSSNPSNNVLLVDMDRWEKLKTKFPDSLAWIRSIIPKF